MSGKHAINPSDVTAAAVEYEDDFNFELEVRHPRVARRTTYFDVIERVEFSDVISEIQIEHPHVRKTVGAIKVADLRLPNVLDTAKSVSSLSGSIIAVKEFPWYLLEAEPTQIEEIGDAGDYDLLAKLAEGNLVSTIIITRQRRRLYIRQRPPQKNIYQACWQGKIQPRKSKVTFAKKEFLPIEEFQRLHELYIEKGIIESDKPYIQDEEELENLRNEIRERHQPYEIELTYSWIRQTSPSLSTAENYTTDTQMSEDYYTDYQSELSGVSDTDSLDWLKQLGMERMHIPGFCKLCPSDLAERFRLDSFSDFSLQRRAIVPIEDLM